MTTAAERDDAIRKLGSITGVSPRGEGETLAAWTRRVAATRPDVFAKEFNGKSTDEVVAIVEEAEYTGLGKQVAAPKPEPKTIVLKAIYKPTGEALEYSPLALNVWRVCGQECSYCYNEKYKPDGVPCTQIISTSTLENIEFDLKALATTGPIKDKNERSISLEDRRAPVHMDFMGDMYDMRREDNSYTRDVLQLFRKHNHPFQMLTKGGTKAVTDFDLYGHDGDRFGVTLTCDNPDDSKRFERYAALHDDRMAALKAAHDRGIATWVSLEPVLIQSKHCT